MAVNQLIFKTGGPYRAEKKGGWMGGKAIVRTVARVVVYMELTRLEPPAT